MGLIHIWGNLPSIKLIHPESFLHGRNSNYVREFLEKNYTETSGMETVKLPIRALLEIVESGGKHIDIAVMINDQGLRLLEESEVEEIVVGIEAEKAVAEAAKQGPPKDS